MPRMPAPVARRTVPASGERDRGELGASRHVRAYVAARATGSGRPSVAGRRGRGQDRDAAGETRGGGPGAVDLAPAEQGDPGGVGGEQTGRHQRRPRASARTRPEQHVEATGRSHRDRPGRGVLEDGVVGPHRPGQGGRRHRGRTPAGEPGQPDTRRGEPDRHPQRLPWADPARRDRPLGALDGVEVPVGLVVERHARPSRAQTEAAGIATARRPQRTGRGGPGQGVARHGEGRRQPDQLGEGSRRGTLIRPPERTTRPARPTGRRAGARRSRPGP